MTATINDGTIIPAKLHEMVEIIVNPEQATGTRHEEYLQYTLGWLGRRAEIEYKELLLREDIPTDPRIVRLLCELAVMRALVQWHEVRDRPPPMPTIDALRTS